MGILSWEGRSGDAGKSSGWSPIEPTCSLQGHGKVGKCALNYFE
jgi:hypothetical protein